VDIVSASVHDTDVYAGVIFCAHVTGVGQAGLFFHGQGIHVSTNQDSGTGAIFHQRDDAVGLAIPAWDIFRRAR